MSYERVIMNAYRDELAELLAAELPRTNLPSNKQAMRELHDRVIPRAIHRTKICLVSTKKEGA